MNASIQTERLIFISGLFALTFFLSSCGTNTTQEEPGITNIHVDTVIPVENQVDIEKFPLPNCGGTSELNQTLGSNASILKSVTIGAKASTEGSGEVSIPETAKLQLKLAIEAAYQQTYKSANSRLDSISMKAAAGTSVTYEIGWYDQTFSSIVQYSEKNKVYSASYTYKLRVPKINNSYQDVCPGNNGDNAQPTSKPQLTATTPPVQPTATMPPVEEPRLEVGQTWT